MKKIYLLLMALFVFGTTFGQDVLNNGNFETWTDSTHPDGWTHVENVTQESTEINGGSYSAKQESTGGTKDLGQTISNIIPGDTYVLTIHYKVESGDGTDARIWSKWKNGNTNLTDNADVLQGPNNQYLPNNGNVWTEYTVNVVAPPTATDFYFEVRTYSNATVYWDDFSFVHQVPTTPTISITSPTPNEVFPPTTTSVDVTFAVQSFIVAQSGGDGHVAWRFDNGTWNIQNDTNPIGLTSLTAGSHTVDVKLVDNSDNDLTPAVSASVTFEVASYTQVADLATLRTSALNGYYHYTGEVFATGAYASQSHNITAFAQDANNVGIMVFALSGVIQTPANLGDGLTDLKGQLVDYHGVLELKLLEDISTTGNNQTIAPQVITANELETNHENYESELIEIDNATVANTGTHTDTDFTTGHNYDLTDASGTTTLRAQFPDLDEALPAAAANVVGIASEYNTHAQIFPRDNDDVTDVPGGIDKNNIEGFKVYPNPVSGDVVFVSSSNNIEKQVVIYDVLGKIVLRTAALNNVAINVSQLKAGIYLMKVKEDNHVAVQQLIVK